MFNGYPVTYEFLGIGAQVSWTTLYKMRDIIIKSSKNPLIVGVARSIVRHTPEKDYYAEAEAIYNWVRRNTKYIRDPYGTETITTPPVALDIIKRGIPFEGDCDDITVLSLSLMRAIGFPVKLIATS